jgi:hypothetical protein
MAKQLRPSPSASATSFPVGHQEMGNDGRMWQAVNNTVGVRRWVPIGMGGATVYTSQIPTNAMHKFKVGDRVKVVQTGYGIGIGDINVETTIVAKGYYGKEPGYRVDFPALGNSQMTASSSSLFDGMVSERSFELVTEQIKQTIITKPLNMAKTKSITKRNTQEVRQIETSLINKEEVFKMLALAEATGLPLLLIGEPGVNSK